LIDLFHDKLLKDESFVFTKFGDGEIICMLDLYQRGDTNCDYQSYSKELSDKLWNAANYYSNNPKIYIGEWKEIFVEKFSSELIRKNINFQYCPYETMLHIERDDIENVVSFYKTLKEKENKIYVCPDRLKEAKNFLNCDLLNVPEKEAFSQYEFIKQELISQDYKIYMYSCGLMSKVLICDVLQSKPNTIHIDIGSGLDNLFYGITRSYQLEKEEVLALY
jgi:hypothetical protein